MRILPSVWHTALSAALGLAGITCNGHSGTNDETNTGASSGGGGTSGSAGAATGGAAADLGGASGTGGAFGGSTTSGVGGGVSGSGGIPMGGVSGTGPLSTGGSAGAAGTTSIDLSCANPRPLMGITGEPTGFVACDGGFTHRAEKRDCGSIVPRPDRIAEPGDGGTGCATDADCANMFRGHCIARSPGPYAPGTPASQCASGCVRDDECGEGAICLCGDPVGHCRSATCTTDADCGLLLCTSGAGPGPTPRCYGLGPFACQTPNDTCRSAQDCQFFCWSSPSGRHCSGPAACD